jgi:hypothetical protein
VTMSKAVNNLLEHVFCFNFLKSLSLFDILQQITTAGIFHNHEEMFLAFENLEQANDVGVPNFFEDENFLEDFFLGEVILHIIFVYCFNRYILASKFVDPESHFTKSAFSN